MNHLHIWVKREANMQGFGKAPLQKDSLGVGRAHIPHRFLVNPPPVYTYVCRCGEVGMPVR